VSKQFVADIKDRDAIKSVFLVKDKILAMAKNGKPYMNLRLMDKSGEVEAKVWDNADMLDRQFSKDDFVQVRGKASIYMNKMQIVVSEIEKLPEEQINLADFLPESPYSIVKMKQELMAVAADISNPHLKALMMVFVSDVELFNQYCQAPAAKGMHHVYLGGLLEHSLSVARLARAIVPLYDGINGDLLVVGALMHDVGKIREMSFARAFNYTDEGKLLGHITIGVEMVEEMIRKVEGFPGELRMLLKHMLLSHHGQYDYGSPKRPKTVEATVLNYLDDLDSKINGIQSHIARETASTSRWTAYHRLYDRYFFKSNGFAGAPEECSDLDEIPPEEMEPLSQVAETPLTRKEKENFKHNPFQTLGNMELF